MQRKWMLSIMRQSRFTNQTRIALIQIMWTLSCLSHTVSMHAKMNILHVFYCMHEFFH